MRIEHVRDEESNYVTGCSSVVGFTHAVDAVWISTTFADANETTLPSSERWRGRETAALCPLLLTPSLPTSKFN